MDSFVCVTIIMKYNCECVCVCASPLCLVYIYVTHYAPWYDVSLSCETPLDKENWHFPLSSSISLSLSLYTPTNTRG